jgi:hypothetical protein
MRKGPGSAYYMWNKNIDIISLVISWSPSLFQTLPLHYKNNFMFMLTQLRFVCDLNMTMLPCTACLCFVLHLPTCRVYTTENNGQNASDKSP